MKTQEDLLGSFSLSVIKINIYHTLASLSRWGTFVTCQFLRVLLKVRDEKINGQPI